MLNFIHKNPNLKSFIILINDLCLVFLSSFCALVIRFEVFYVDINQLINFFFLSSGIYILLFFYFKIHRQINRYFNEKSIEFYFKLLITYFIILITTVFLLHYFVGYPRSFAIIQPLIFFILFYVNRALVQKFFNIKKNKKTNIRKAIIYCSSHEISSFYNLINPDYKIIAFIVNSDEFSNRSIFNIPILSYDNLNKILLDYKFDNFFMKEGTLDIFNKKFFISRLFQSNIQFNEVAGENIGYRIIRDIDIGALFLREKSLQKVNYNFTNKEILITGGAGSIGSELCRQILSKKPKKLIIIDINELGLYNLEKKLSLNLLNKSDVNIEYILGSIGDEILLKSIFKRNQINIIYHAAAYKHVPILEDNILTAFKNNFNNTYMIASLCNDYNIDRFVLVSSDKAVRPTNIMGATKRLSELSIKYFHEKFNSKLTNTVFSIVRFGNVLESSGSAIPLFKKQILEDRKITITHPEITRYFMSIEEAVYLIIQSSIVSKGGEIFLLDMGEPIKIIDLVINMIKLAGLEVKNDKNPNGDVEIKYIGLRPGEKLYEELLLEDSNSPTEFKNIYISNEKFLKIENYENIFSLISKSIEEENIVSLKELIKDVNIGYKTD